MKQVVLALAFVLGVASVPASAASFTLTPLISTVTVGELFYVDVVANDPFDDAAFDPADFSYELTGFGFNTSGLDPAVAEFVGSVTAPGFDNTSSLVGLDAAGLAVPLGIPYQASPFQVPLATLTFRALAVGTTSLGIVGDALNFDQGLQFISLDTGDFISLDISGGARIEVLDAATPVPEPTTMVLLGTGAAIAAVRRRRAQR